MLIAFDFDGTICDSLPAAVKIGQDYAARHHLDLISPSQARRLGLKGLMRHYHISPIRLPSLVLELQKAFAKQYPHLKPVPDLPAVIKQLAQTHQLCIVTNTPVPTVNTFLARHHLNSYFSFIDADPDLFGKHRKLKIHHPDFYIGDMVRDVEAAKKAGCKSIAVTWGFELDSRLTATHPDFVAHKPQDLLKLLL